ncbi:MAG: DUF742 domain-containing protein [Actinoallomurus sp.]
MTSPGPGAEEDPDTDEVSWAEVADLADAEERWLDDQAGPLVRPYVMTSGRMQPIRGTFDLVTLVEATGLTAPPELGLGPEHQAALRLCEQVMSVAEIAGHLKLPTVTVRVLLGDLLDKGLVTVQDPRTDDEFMNDEQMYRAVIDGLHAL